MSDVLRALDTVKRAVGSEMVHHSSMLQLIKATELAITRVSASRYEHGYAAGLLAAVGIMDQNAQGGPFPKLSDPATTPHAADDMQDMSSVPVVARALAARHWIMDAQAQVRAAKAHAQTADPLETIEGNLRELVHDLTAIGAPHRLPQAIRTTLNQIAQKCSDAGLDGLPKPPVLEEIQRLAVGLLDAPAMDVSTEELDEAVQQAADLIAPAKLREPVESLVPEPGAIEEALGGEGLLSLSPEDRARALRETFPSGGVAPPSCPTSVLVRTMSPAGVMAAAVSIKDTGSGRVHRHVLDDVQGPVVIELCESTLDAKPVLDEQPDIPEGAPLAWFVSRLAPHRCNLQPLTRPSAEVTGTSASMMQNDAGAYVPFRAVMACLGDLVDAVAGPGGDYPLTSVQVRVESRAAGKNWEHADEISLVPGVPQENPAGTLRFTLCGTLCQPASDEGPPESGVDVVRAAVKVKKGMTWEEVVGVQGGDGAEDSQIGKSVVFGDVGFVLALRPATGVAGVHLLPSLAWDDPVTLVQGKTGDTARVLFPLGGHEALLEVVVPSTIQLTPSDKAPEA